MQRSDLVTLISDCVGDQAGTERPPDEDTVLFGEGGVLDSFGLVALLVEVEQRLDEEFGVTVVLGDDRAMSQKRSPFRSIGALADYTKLVLDGD